ncbi:MAG TPA: alpha/beta hydrolase [Terrimicrobiaceae bacterium]
MLKQVFGTFSRKRLFIGSLLGVGALAPLFLPSKRRLVTFHPKEKPLTYSDAVEQIRSLASAAPDSIRRECIDQLLEHGQPTEHVFVLLHGLSNCPAQFSQLGQRLFELGHNVVIPRLPYHGERNSLASEWAQLTATEMIVAGNRAVDLARSLGSKVTVAGISANGATVAWLAQNRSDLHRAVLLAPFLSPVRLPKWATRPLERLLLGLPNIFLWWNAKQKENIQRPYYAYPRFPTRVIGQTMFLAQEVLRESRLLPPACGSIVVITSASDTAANHQVTRQLVNHWKVLGGSSIITYEFPAEQEVPHDCIDPNQPNQKVAVVYPKLLQLLQSSYK